MDGWEDYYQTLQIHFMAEPEVIKGAYVKLCKKYHPDINPDELAGDKMKQINKAYEVLSHPISRKQYLVKWFERHNGLYNQIPPKKPMNAPIGFSTEPSRSVLTQYFNAIQKRRYSLSYGLLAEEDRKNITLKDYIHWLTLVSEVFELKGFQCEVDNMYSEVEINDNHFLLVVQYQVTVVEKNNVMDRIEEDRFIKNVVYQDNQWHVFLGYVDLKSVIKKFNDLANLKKRKTVVALKLKKGRSVNLLSRKEFLQQAEKEQNRMNRYGNAFSIIWVINEENQESQLNEVSNFESMIKEIIDKLRILDFGCRWKNGKFLILLPETDLEHAQKVIKIIDEKVQKTSQIKLYAIQQKYDNIKKLIQLSVHREFESTD